MTETRTAAPFVAECLACGGSHATETEQNACYDAESAAEIHAEGAWLRAAEAGNPDTWVDEDRERQIAFEGYGPPPGL